MSVTLATMIKIKASHRAPYGKNAVTSAVSVFRHDRSPFDGAEVMEWDIKRAGGREKATRKGRQEE